MGAVTFMPAFATIVAVLSAHVILTWYTAIRRGLSANQHPEEVLPLPQTWPSVSIIVPAWRERGTLETCLATLQAIDYPSWEGIIVAGGPDGTYESAQKVTEGLTNFTVLEQAPYGKNAALNQGLAVAKGDVVVFLDADSRVAPDWLRELVRPLNDSVQATTGNILPVRVTSISSGIQMEWIKARELDRQNSLSGGGGIALQREIIEKIGGLPEEVRVGVDWDLNSRLAMQRVDCAYCRHAVVETELPSSIPEYWHNELRWRRAHLSSLLRHSSYFLGSPKMMIRSIYIYLLSWGGAIATLAMAFFILPASGRMALPALVLWTALVSWVLLRRGSLAAAVAAYTLNLDWLKLAWVPPLLLILTLAAILPASLSLGTQSAHFKGPRRRQPLIPSER